MTFSSIPPVTASLIATTENILHIAPVSKGWKAGAPSNVVFLPPTINKQVLLMQIGLLRPTTIIVADQTIDADIIDQWRISHPFGDLCLIRRGTGLDKVRLDLCRANGIQVVNTPGVSPATLTTHATTTEACNRDLDYAVCIQLSLMALRGLVRQQLAHSLTIPSQPVEAGAPRVAIIGRGIDGLLHAVMLRLANYQVVVYAGIQQSDGARHRLPANPYLAVECQRAGIELFEKFLTDNPSLAALAQAQHREW